MYQQYFADSYARARDLFNQAAANGHCRSQAFVNPAGPGPHAESLSTDVAYFGDPDARALLVLTSATHGAEGYCGSGCQVALLDDTALLDKARAGDVAILFIHAVNPYGFAWAQRTTEDGVDLNRNFLSFEQPPPDNPHYRSLHGLLLPQQWPPSEENEQAIADFITREGMQAYREGVMLGQYSHADGLFYGGREPAWSNRTLRNVLKQHGEKRERLAWIDYHTGLGPYGHGEKIFVQNDAKALARARAWWGADVVAVSDPDSSTVDIKGTTMQALLEECGQVPELTFMALEYGTLPLGDVFRTLRADRWLARQGSADSELVADIRTANRKTFYPDHDDWRGAVLGQSRVAVLQAIYGLSAG